LATHGFFLAPACDSAGSTVGAYLRDAPLLRSGLALSGFNGRRHTLEDREDGVLTAEEIAALDLSGVDGVVLSACESGLGLATTGEGVIGLRRAFQAAGAGTLVTSMWSVRDRPARLWMLAFYASLAHGRTPEEAAFEASSSMLSILRAGERAPHPADWGAFMVVGGLP
jgi:CHAT domain-containing protein